MSLARRFPPVRLVLLVGGLIGAIPLGIAPAQAEDASDAAVAAWARERLAPLSGAAERNAAAAFDAGAKTPPRTTPTPTPPAFPPAARGADRYATPPSPRVRPGGPSTTVGNPLRAGATLSTGSSTRYAPAARRQPDTAARRAFGAATPLAPEPASGPLRIELGSEAALPVATSDAAPAERAPERPVAIPAAAFAEPPAPRARPAAGFAKTDEPRAFPGANEPARLAALPPRATPAPPPTLPVQATAPMQAASVGPLRTPPARSAGGAGNGRPGPATLAGPQRASVVVEKRGPDEARVGQTCRFVITVRNTGQTPAARVTLTDETPEGARLVETRPVADQTGSRLTWGLGTLAAGEERTVELLVEPVREGPIGSVAAVSFDARATATTRATRPAVALRVQAAERVRVGERQRLEIELHNPGTGVATGVLITEDIPAGMSHEAGPELEFEVGSLAPGETRRLDLAMTAENAGRVVNTVRVTADGDLSAEARTEFEVVAPELALAVNGPSRRYLERPATYRVEVANPGTATATDVRLVTHLPRAMKFVSANNLGEYDEPTHAVYWSLAELPEGQRGAVEVVAMPVAAGDHTLRVESEAADGLRAEESRRLRVEGVALLAFDVRDRQDPIEQGDDADYDIRVTNEGTKAATGVRIVVEAPRGMTISDARGETAARTTTDRVEFAPLGRLMPGAEARFRVLARGSQPGDHRVTVLVSSDDAPEPIRREESTRVFGDE